MVKQNLLVAGWSFTNACNLKCKHCYNASGKLGKDELTLEEAIRVADKLKEVGVTAVNFGGGECALRKDFIDLCKYLKKLDIKISYTTNGTTYKIIEKHLDLFDDVGVSIDFGEGKKHDEFRGVRGTFNKAITTLKKLKEKGMDTEIVTCITKLNCSEKELEKIHKLAEELKVDYWRLNRFRANGRGEDNKNYLALSKKELKKAYDYLSKYVTDYDPISEPLFRAAHGGKYAIEGDPSGITALRIQPNGEVTPSVFLKLSGGNIKEKTLTEILNSKTFQAIRNRKPRGKCGKCTSYYHCKGGDAGASYLEYGHFDGPDPLCWLKPESAKKYVPRYIPEKWNVHEMYLCTLYIPVKGGKDATKT